MPGLRHSPAWWRVYEAVRRRGAPKSLAARIANTTIEEVTRRSAFVFEQVSADGEVTVLPARSIESMVRLIGDGSGSPGNVVEITSFSNRAWLKEFDTPEELDAFVNAWLQDLGEDPGISNGRL